MSNSGKRKNINKSTVESSYAEQTISSGISWTGIIWIYIIWKKCRYFILFYLCRRKCLLLYNIFYVHYHSVHYWCSMFQPVFRKLNNKGRTASIFALLTGISMLSMYFFNVKESPVAFYALAGITQFFFSGFNTAIYAIIPDCVEYGEWKTGFRNDGFQYAFVSLGNKIGMAIGTALLAALLGKYGYIANQTQNPEVIAIMKHAFSTIPGICGLLRQLFYSFID